MRILELDYLTSSSGSGKGNMLLLIANCNFAGSSEFVYLYSEFSSHDAGFEEWAVSAAAAASRRSRSRRGWAF